MCTLYVYIVTVSCTKSAHLSASLVELVALKFANDENADDAEANVENDERSNDQRNLLGNV